MNHCITRFAFLFVVALLVLGIHSDVRAQGPQGKSFGFGFILIEPFGGTIKVWTNPINAFVVDLGVSDFGDPRLQGDYLWHFDAFHSRIVKMYAGPGLALAFGEYSFENGNSGVGVGVRGIFGINVIPTSTPLEIFFELGPLIALSPGFGAALDAGLGLRFYP
jgi:hypothetical protein